MDGIGAYDHIFRATMLEKLAGLPTANRILPFVRLFYAATSNYIWTDAECAARVIQQAEGGEQGDPLMPALLLFRHS